MLFKEFQVLLSCPGALATKSRMGTIHIYTRQQTRLANTHTPPSQHNEESRNCCPAHLLSDDHDLLRCNVLKGEHKAPVEVALPIHRAIVNVCLLNLILTTKPAGDGKVE